MKMPCPSKAKGSTKGISPNRGMVERRKGGKKFMLLSISTVEHEIMILGRQFECAITQVGFRTYAQSMGRES